MSGKFASCTTLVEACAMTCGEAATCGNESTMAKQGLEMQIAVSRFNHELNRRPRVFSMDFCSRPESQASRAKIADMQARLSKVPPKAPATLDVPGW